MTLREARRLFQNPYAFIEQLEEAASLSAPLPPDSPDTISNPPLPIRNPIPNKIQNEHYIRRPNPGHSENRHH